MPALILVAPMMTVASFILRKGVVKAGKKYGPKLINKAKQYIKKNKLILSGNKVIKPKKSQIKTVRPTNKKPTTTKKINPNKNEGKPTTKPTTKPKTTTTGTNKPVTGTTKPGTKSFAGKGAAIGGGLVGAAILIKSKSKDKDKKTETKKSVPTAPKGFKDKGSPGRGVSKGTAFDDMLGGKSVATKPSGFKDKGSKGRGASAFGNNISFTSKDVKTLRENAKMLKKQIDGLDITNMQKLRLKKVIDTREKGYSMDESYRRAFNTVKKRVKDNKLNFAIDVSGYAGKRTD